MTLPTPFYERDGITIYVGDNREVLPHIEPVHAVVTDPPYGLSFMGKGWDHSVPGVEFWQAISNAILPGAHLLAFGGSRTYHRMAVAIEDAGYEIRDTLQWLYGSGMPKGWNFSNRIPADDWCRCTGGNAVSYNHEGGDHGEPQTEHNLRSMWHADVPASVHIGAERREVLHTSVSEPSAPAYRETNSTGFHEGREQPGMEGRAIHRAGEGVCDDTPTGSPTSTAQRVRAGAHSGSGTNARQTTGTGRGSASHQPAEGRQPTGELADLPESPRPLDDRALRNGGACPRCGKLSQDFQGFDVALKPAYEPIIMARLPFKGTVAANVLAHGTGAINVDACRIGPPVPYQPGGWHHDHTINDDGWKGGVQAERPATGRWPANVILDEAAAEALDAQSGVSVSRASAGRNGKDTAENTWGMNRAEDKVRGHNDTGGASRFFYVAKASRRERNAGLDGMPEKVGFRKNTSAWKTDARHPDGGYVNDNPGAPMANSHPCVKPLALMRYLIQMVTPPGGIILDPFMGSGSTLVAAAELGFDAIGIELSEEYAEIAARRVDHALNEQAKRLPGLEATP